MVSHSIYNFLLVFSIRVCFVNEIWTGIGRKSRFLILNVSSEGESIKISQRHVTDRLSDKIVVGLAYITLAAYNASLLKSTRNLMHACIHSFIHSAHYVEGVESEALEAVARWSVSKPSLAIARAA